MSQEEDTARLDEPEPIMDANPSQPKRQFNKGDAVQYRNLEAFGVITSYYRDRTRISCDGYRYVVKWLITPPSGHTSIEIFCPADDLNMMPTPLQDVMQRAAGAPDDITTQGALDYARSMLVTADELQKAGVALDDIPAAVATTAELTPLPTVASTFQPGQQVLHVTHTSGGFLRLPGTVMSVKTANGQSYADDGYIYEVHWWSEPDPKNLTHHASQFLLPYVPEPEATPTPRDLPHRYLSDDARLIPKHCMVCGKTPDDDVHKAVDIPPAQPTYDHSTQPHPFRGQAWADWVCMVCSLRPDHSIHDDPRAGQDFDWRPSAPVLTPVSAPRLLEHLRTIRPDHEGTLLNAKWELAQQLIEDIEKGLYR